ncbi:MAG: HD domain-containing protein [Butyrivibrio sp.]|nr:HD domain-containing protein [Butyrivibrio sp.]
MFDFIREHQLNIMLLLCGASGTLALLLFITRFLTKRRKWALIIMELVAMFLLWFDRLAYTYAGHVGPTAFLMVRLSNFIVFFLTPTVVFGFNMFICDYLTDEGGVKMLPRRIKAVSYISAIGMFLAIVSAFTGLYYYFDLSNTYHRGKGFLIAYIIPVICPLVQYTVIRQYKKSFSKLIYTSMLLYIFCPLVCGIIQIFAYGISIVNMAMVLVSISLYIFTYMDINNTVENAHEIEIQHMQGQQRRMLRLFDQLAKAFVSAVEKKDEFTKGNAVKKAEYARKLARLRGKSDDDCNKAYYAALLHDVGMIGIDDAIIKNEMDPGALEIEAFRQKPVIGKEILSNITEYPYLSIGAAYSHERYNGTGYPEGLKGEEIPEIARLVAVVDAYVTMTTPKRYRDAKPDFVAREALVKGAGEEFDPVYADLMVKIIDEESKDKIFDDIALVEKELTCDEYKKNVALGIPVIQNITNISFNFEPSKETPTGFSAPSIILFDSFDRRIHDDARAIRAYHYKEYGEIWFDNHSITTAARKIVETMIDSDLSRNDNDKNAEGIATAGRYEITAVKFEDHLKLTMTSPDYKKEAIVAVMDGSSSVYIGLTGEYCKLTDISIQQTDETINAADIPRISDEISYINHMESDLPNVQINQTRSASTEGIEIRNKHTLNFHTMSLPVADFVWNCPYIVIFSSDNGRMMGRNYTEYVTIKLNGEIDRKEDVAENNFIMKRKDTFLGWESWKEKNKEGFECEINFERKGNRITTITENQGVYVENTTIIKKMPDKVYVAITGDRCALTDIRIK